MTLHTVRATLYKIARALGDVQALEHGTVPKCLVRMIPGEEHAMRSTALFGVLVILAGCAGLVTDVASLQAQGYKKSPMTFVTATGEQREMTNCDLWVKVTRPEGASAHEAGQIVHACLVPKTSGAGFDWRLTVYVDDKDTWSYESGRGPFRQWIDCTTSRPLPEGRLSWRVWYTYWQ